MMAQIIPNLIVALVMAAIAGLFFIAYYHPSFYRKFYIWPIIITSIISIILQMWRLIIYLFLKNISDIIPPNEIDAVKSYVESLKIGPMWPFLILFAVQIGLLFITYLPTVHDREDKKPE